MTERARLLNRIVRVLLIIGVLWGILIAMTPVGEARPNDRAISALILALTALTAICTLSAQVKHSYQVSALCFIALFSLVVTIAVWQFGRRIPEVHLGYFISIALAAMFWGSGYGNLAAILHWILNATVVAIQPEVQFTGYTMEELVGVMTLGASFLGVGVIVGRYAESLVDALNRAKKNEGQAAQAEELVRRNARDLERALAAEQTHRRELDVLYRLAERVAGRSRLNDILPYVVKALTSSLEVTVALIVLIDRDEESQADWVRVAACHPIRVLGWHVEIGRKERLSALPHVVRALETRKALVLELDKDGAMAEVESEFLYSDSMHSLAIIPIISDETALGVIVAGEMRSVIRARFSSEKLTLARSIADLVAGAIQRSRLFEEREEAYTQTVLALASAVEAKDTYTADHAERLAQQAELVARKLGVEDLTELEALRFGAMLHDVGKIGVPDSILKKPASLDDGEWLLMRQHPLIGFRILEKVERLRGAARIVRHHHERWDGRGYPDGLAGEEIPLGARVLTVVDSYTAIIDARVYKPARSHAEAVEELRRHAGTQFDPRAVEAFLESFGNCEEVSSSVHLRLTLARLPDAFIDPKKISVQNAE